MDAASLALSKGRIFDETQPLLARVGIRAEEAPERSRKLVIGTNRPDLRLIIVRAADTPTYVQHGGADLDVVLFEPAQRPQQRDVGAPAVGLEGLERNLAIVLWIDGAGLGGRSVRRIPAVAPRSRLTPTDLVAPMPSRTVGAEVPPKTAGRRVRVRD